MLHNLSVIGSIRSVAGLLGMMAAFAKCLCLHYRRTAAVTMGESALKKGDPVQFFEGLFAEQAGVFAENAASDRSLLLLDILCLGPRVEVNRRRLQRARWR